MSDAAFDALGFRFGVRSNDPDLEQWLNALFTTFDAIDGPACLYSIEVDGDDCTLLLDGDVIVKTTSRGQVAASLICHVNRNVVEIAADNLLLHASAVARGNDAVICPAPMESGKTTLAAGLVRVGLDYVTDETVAIEPESFRIRAYAKPLSIDRGSWEVLADLAPEPSKWMADQWQVPATDIRPNALAGPSSPRFIVAPRYDAVILLAENSFNFKDDGRRWLPVLGDVVKGCECYRLSIADLDDACKLVLELFDR